jgi:flavin-dependent dehydrogenase
MYDTVIIGAGPAGSALARFLPRGQRALLLDRRRLEKESTGRYRKVCGGLLAPDAQQEICRQGLSLPENILTGPQLFGVRTMDLSTDRERYYQRFYFNMDREAFDRWLFSLVPGNVEKITGASVKSVRKTADGFEIMYLKDGRPSTVASRNIVGADGAGSLVRRSVLSDKKRTIRYLAVQEWFEVKEPVPWYGAIFDPDITDFYAWTICKEGCLIIGAALRPGPDVRGKFSLLKDKLRKKGLSWGDRDRREAAFIERPVSPGMICRGRGNAALTGEAAGWISPSSAEGISFALKSGAALARAMRKQPDGFVEQYARETASLKRTITAKILKSPGMYSPALRNLILRTGFHSFVTEPMLEEKLSEEKQHRPVQVT